MLAGEAGRNQVEGTITFPGRPVSRVNIDLHPFYVMASYHATGKLSAGLYYSSILNREVAPSSGRYQKDWTLATRYDFNPFLYAKFEQHFIDGTQINYSASDNANLQPDTRMTLLKLGVSF